MSSYPQSDNGNCHQNVLSCAALKAGTASIVAAATMQRRMPAPWCLAGSISLVTIAALLRARPPLRHFPQLLAPGGYV